MIYVYRILYNSTSAPSGDCQQPVSGVSHRRLLHASLTLLLEGPSHRRRAVAQSKARRRITTNPTPPMARPYSCTCLPRCLSLKPAVSLPTSLPSHRRLRLRRLIRRQLALVIAGGGGRSSSSSLGASCSFRHCSRHHKTGRMNQRCDKKISQLWHDLVGGAESRPRLR